MTAANLRSASGCVNFPQVGQVGLPRGIDGRYPLAALDVGRSQQVPSLCLRRGGGQDFPIELFGLNQTPRLVLLDADGEEFGEGGHVN